MTELKTYLDEKISEHKMLLGEQAERKASSTTIRFGTSTTKVLTSSICLGRLSLYREWKSTKDLKKKDLLQKMIENYGFLESDVKNKKVPELKKMAEDYLLSREKDLVDTFQKELDAIPVPLPPSITNFFQPSGEVHENLAEEDEEFELLEKEVISFLEKREASEFNEEEQEENSVAILSSLFATLL